MYETSEDFTLDVAQVLGSPAVDSFDLEKLDLHALSRVRPAHVQRGVVQKISFISLGGKLSGLALEKGSLEKC